MQQLIKKHSLNCRLVCIYTLAIILECKLQCDSIIFSSLLNLEKIIPLIVIIWNQLPIQTYSNKISHRQKMAFKKTQEHVVGQNESHIREFKVFSNKKNGKVLKKF